MIAFLDQIVAPPIDFVGRESEIAQAMERLSRGGLVVIAGPVGLGKTSLARAVAAEARDSYPDGCIAFNGRGVRISAKAAPEATLAEVHAHVALSFEPLRDLPETTVEVEAAYRESLTGKRVLILVDDAPEAMLEELTLPPEGCGLMVTTLNAVRAVAACTVSLEGLSDQEAEAFVSAVCPRLAGSGSVLIGVCESNPFALHLAVAYLAHNEPLDAEDYRDAFVNALAEEIPEPVDDGAIPVPPVVNAAFSLNVKAMGEELAVLAGRLVASPFAFDLEEAACMLHAETSEEAEETLSELTAWGFLENEGSDFRMHYFARRFFSDRQSGELSRLARQRFFYYHLGAFFDGIERFNGATNDRDASLRVLWREWESWKLLIGGMRGGFEALAASETSKMAGMLSTARSVLFKWTSLYGAPPFSLGEWLEDGGLEGDEIASAMAQWLGPAWAKLGDVQRTKRYYGLILESHRKSGNTRDEASAAGHFGIFLRDHGYTDDAIAHLRRWGDLAKELGELQEVASALAHVGYALASEEKFDAAIAEYESALEFANGLGDRQLQIWVEGYLGVAYCNAKRPEEAIPHLNAWLSLAEKEGDSSQMCSAYGWLSDAYLAMGEFEKAVKQRRRGVDLAERRNLQKEARYALHRLGNLYSDQNRREDAIPHYERWLALARAQGARWSEAQASGCLGIAHLNVGRPDLAFPLLLAWSETAAEFGYNDEALSAASWMAKAYESNRDPKRALELLEKQKAVACEYGDASKESIALLKLGTTYLDLAQDNFAVEVLQDAILKAIEAGDVHVEKSASSCLGVAFGNLGENERSLEAHLRALELARKDSDRKHEAGTLWNLGLLYASLDRPESTRDALEAWLTMDERDDSPENEAWCFSHLGYVYGRLGDDEKTLEYSLRGLTLYEAMFDVEGQGMCLENAAEASENLGRVSEAIELLERAVAIHEEAGSTPSGEALERLKRLRS